MTTAGIDRSRSAVEPNRILVIDDDGPTRELLTEVLSRDGHQVVAEATAAGGRDQALAGGFDLILSDIGLPDLDGIALVQQLRAAGVVAPIVALSGHTDEVDRQKGRAAGFDAYLFKPIKASALRAEVARRAAGEPGLEAEPASGSDPWLSASATDEAPRAEPVPAAAISETAAAPGELRPVAEPRVLGRPRGVLGGLVVVAMGVPFIMQQLGVPNAASYLFITMGLAFLAAYLRNRQYAYLIPMVALASFGVALLLPTWVLLRPEVVAPAFVGVVGLGFLAAFALQPGKRWPLVPATILGGVALIRLVTGSSFLPGSVEPLLVPVTLVVVGCYLLLDHAT